MKFFNGGELMKQPKRPTREQKAMISSYHLNPNHWMVVGETELYLKIVNKETGKLRLISKYRKRK